MSWSPVDWLTKLVESWSSPGMGPVPQANHGKHFTNKMRGLQTLQKEIALDLRIHVCVWPFFLHMSRTHDTSAVMAYAKFRFDYFSTVEVTLNTKKNHFSETLPDHGCPCGHLWFKVVTIIVRSLTCVLGWVGGVASDSEIVQPGRLVWYRKKVAERGFQSLELDLRWTFQGVSVVYVCVCCLRGWWIDEILFSTLAWHCLSVVLTLHLLQK